MPFPCLPWEWGTVTQPPSPFLSSPPMHAFIFFFFSLCRCVLRPFYVLDVGKSQGTQEWPPVAVAKQCILSFESLALSCCRLRARKPLHVDPTHWVSRALIQPSLLCGRSSGSHPLCVLVAGGSSSDSCHRRGCLIDGEMWWEEEPQAGLDSFILDSGTLCSDLIFQHLNSFSVCPGGPTHKRLIS